MASKHRPQALVFLDGKVVSPQEARVSVFDRGFLFGDGVYETGRSYDRCFLFLEEHWMRLRHSAEKLLIPVPWTDSVLTEGLFQTARLFGKNNVYFRTIVTRGEIDRVGLDVAVETTPTLVHIIQNLTDMDEKRAKGLSLATSKVVRNSARAQDPNIKTSNYLNSLLALQDARARGAEDAVLCDADGNVTEGTTFSIFGVTEAGTLITPSLDVGILESITRRHVIRVASSQGLKLEEGHYPLSALLNCREIFATSSLREILPVREWDGKEFPVSGEITRKLHEALREDIRQYLSAHPKY